MQKILLTSLLIAAFFCSCMTEKKARRNADKFFKEHPGELAGLCAETFPTKIEYKKGDSILVIKRDSIFIPADSVECPPVLPGAKSVKVKCPESKVITNTILRVDTVTVENTAKIHSLAFRLDTTGQAAAVLRDKLQKAETERDEWKGTAKKRYWFIWLLIGLMGTVVILKLKKIF